MITLDGGNKKFTAMYRALKYFFFFLLKFFLKRRERDWFNICYYFLKRRVFLVIYVI